MAKMNYTSPLFTFVPLATSVRTGCRPEYYDSLEIAPFESEKFGGDIIFTNDACAEEGWQLDKCFGIPFADGTLFNS